MIFTNIILFALIQNASLIHTDIFYTTKPYIENGTSIERNPIAKIYFDNGLWQECYYSSLIACYALAEMLHEIDRTYLLSNIAMSMISLAEILVIYDNYRQEGLVSVDIHATLIRHVF